jgi:hypothetical protein
MGENQILRQGLVNQVNVNTLNKPANWPTKFFYNFIDLIKSKFNVDFSGHFRFDTHHIIGL